VRSDKSDCEASLRLDGRDARPHTRALGWSTAKGRDVRFAQDDDIKEVSSIAP